MCDREETRERGWTAIRPLLFAAALSLVVFGGACGPIEYVNQVTRKASAEVEAARAVSADRYAPYYYTLAVEYLRKAREEASYADYQAANRFGRKAAEAAVKAREVAIARAADPDGADDLPPIGGDSGGGP